MEDKKPLSNWKPKVETEIILDRAYSHIESVPYRVSLRWVFYRLLQDGAYRSKDDYGNLKHILIEARKKFYKEWRPDTLSDETRTAILQVAGFETPSEWLSTMVDRAAVRLDPWYNQPFYIELFFEAKAMVGQFKHIVPFVTLVPFGGDASVPFKWEIAKRLETAFEEYGRPIKILYFGDLDTKGLQIPDSAMRDIREWCNAPIDFELCGLTREQAEKFKLPDNPEKPGQFQWEALSDEQAREIIEKALEKYIDDRKLGETAVIERKATLSFREQIKRVIL